MTQGATQRPGARAKVLQLEEPLFVSNVNTHGVAAVRNVVWSLALPLCRTKVPPA